GLWAQLFRLGLFFARPGAGERGEGWARLVIHRGPGAPEDAALEDGGQDHLAEARVAVLRVRRLAFVDHPPELLEQLPAREAGDQSADDAERDEEQLEEQIH